MKNLPLCIFFLFASVSFAVAQGIAPGLVSIDQTTPGTTNGVVVNSSALPTGAASSANQTAPLPAQGNLTTNVGNVGQTNGDPCSVIAHSFTPINIATNANTKIVSGTASKKTYLCHLFLFGAGANNVGIVEGSGTNCGSSALGLIGGNTAAAGVNLAANQGFESGTGTNAIAATTVNANDVCLITSTSAQLSGVAVTVQQ